MGEFGGVCRPNSPLELAKTQLETLAACKKWCKIGGAPNLDWGEIDLTPNPQEVRIRVGWRGVGWGEVMAFAVKRAA